MQFKLYQRVTWEMGETRMTGVILRRFPRRGFIEILVLSDRGTDVPWPYTMCFYPDADNLKPA